MQRERVLHYPDSVESPGQMVGQLLAEGEDGQRKNHSAALIPISLDAGLM